jgi:hypothetical protein
MIKNLLKLSRKTKQALILLFDFIAIICCLFAAFAMRLGYWYYTAEKNVLMKLSLF